VRIQLRNLMVAEAEVVSPTEGSIWATGMRGCQEPPESLAQGTLPRILQELGKASLFPPSKTGVVHLSAKDRALAGTDAAAEGANKHPAEEVADGRGRPETVGKGQGGLL
jgi:hypothetical protein